MNLYNLNIQCAIGIGNPKLLSLFLASKIGSRVYCTNLSDYFIVDFNQFREIFQLSMPWLRH